MIKKWLMHHTFVSQKKQHITDPWNGTPFQKTPFAVSLVLDGIVKHGSKRNLQVLWDTREKHKTAVGQVCVGPLHLSECARAQKFLPLPSLKYGKIPSRRYGETNMIVCLQLLDHLDKTRKQVQCPFSYTQIYGPGDGTRWTTTQNVTVHSHQGLEWLY